MGLGTNLKSTVNLGSVGDEVNDTARVTVLVVVPRDELDKVGVQRDTSLGIEDGAVGVTQEVSGDNFVFGVAENALEFTLRGLLDSFLNFVVGGALLEADSQVDNRDIRVGNTEGHTSQLAVEMRNDLAHS